MKIFRGVIASLCCASLCGCPANQVNADKDIISIAVTTFTAVLSVNGHYQLAQKILVASQQAKDFVPGDATSNTIQILQDIEADAHSLGDAKLDIYVSLFVNALDGVLSDLESAKTPATVQTRELQVRTVKTRADYVAAFDNAVQSNPVGVSPVK